MNWALAQQTGSPAAKSVLLILANRAGHDGRCWPGIEGIADQTELARRTVIGKIQELEAGGFFCVEHRGGTGKGRKSNVYLLHIGAKCSSCTLGLSANEGKQCATDAGLSAAPAPEPSINHQKNHQSRGAGAPDFSKIENLNMEAWDIWQAYRRKTKRKKYTTDMKARELAKLPSAAQAACVNHSIGNEYAGLFPDKFKLGGGKKSYYDELAEGIDKLNEQGEGHAVN